MSPRPLSVLGGSLIVIAVGLTVAVGATFDARPSPFALLVGLWALVGALLVALRPVNAVGWLFAAAGLFWLTGMIASSAANPRQIWIAGGIGVTPFLSMARHLEPGGYQIDLYYCTEHAEQAHFLASSSRSASAIDGSGSSRFERFPWATSAPRTSWG
jgi:hypothetical protein